jgi:DNA-binding HxlR family transcriptional regulator
MPRMRSYGQYCGLAHALEIVGERWALLIVRDLVSGPKRFTDLRVGLPRIPTNVLSSRLKELEDAGVVRRRTLPRPAASVAYELTGYGVELEDIVLRLSRWGASTLDEPKPEDVVTPDGTVLALRAAFDPEAARGVDVGYEVRANDVVVHALVKDGTLTAGEGGLAEPDLVVELNKISALKLLLAGEVTPEAAVDTELVDIIGPAEELERLARIFSLRPVRPELSG